MPLQLTTRCPLERILCLAALLRSGKRFTGREVAARFEVNEKTIYRDIEFLRDRLGFEVEFKPAAMSWRLIRAPRAALL